LQPCRRSSLLPSPSTRDILVRSLRSLRRLLRRGGGGLPSKNPNGLLARHSQSDRWQPLLVEAVIATIVSRNRARTRQQAGFVSPMNSERAEKASAYPA
jgi:hypothetical protein